MTGRYAEGTEVSTDRSRVEIEGILRRYGADKFMYGWEARRAVVGFAFEGRQIRMTLPLPDESEFAETPTGRERTERQVKQEYEKEVRRLWRALCLLIKAKLEAIASGISTLEEQFLPYLVLPNGHTIGEQVLPQIEQVLAKGQLPPLLPWDEE